MAGITPADVDARTKRAFAAHELPTPTVGAMGYMLSQQQYLGDTDPHWMPHLMFYYDKSVSASALGAGGFTAPIIDATVGDPLTPITTVLIPVAQWSDGSPVTHSK